MREGDARGMAELARRARLTRDRATRPLWAVLLAQDRRESMAIAQTLRHSRPSVQDYAYGDGGIDDPLPDKSSGNVVKSLFHVAKQAP